MQQPVLNLYHVLGYSRSAAQGFLVAFIHGADGGRMRMKIQEELKKEMSVREGKMVQELIKLEEAIPPSDLHLDADFEKLEEEEERLKNKGTIKEVTYSIANGRVILVHKSIIDETKKYEVMKEYLPACGFHILDKKVVEMDEVDAKQLESAPKKVKDIFTNTKCGILLVKYSGDTDSEEAQFFSLSSEVPKGAKVKPLQKKLDLKDSVGFFCLDDTQSIHFVKKNLKLEFETGQYEDK